MAKQSSKAARDNRANQLNPNNERYHKSRGGSGTDRPASPPANGGGAATPPAPKSP